MSEGERSVVFFNPDLGIEARLESKEKCQLMTQSRLSVLIESNKDSIVFGHFNNTGSYYESLSVLLHPESTAEVMACTTPNTKVVGGAISYTFLVEWRYEL